MKILHVFAGLMAAAFVLLAPALNAQNYIDLYNPYNYKANLKASDTTFLNRLITGTCQLDSSALAQFNSTTQGILVPRLTTAQMDSISNPANGLLVYNITAGYFFYYNDSAWISIGAPTASTGGWNLNGNGGTNTGANYIGTSDSNGLAFKTANTTFGYADSLQHYNFNTTLGTDVYGVMTTGNGGGMGLNALFSGDESAWFGYYCADAQRFGLSRHLLLAGSPQHTHLLVDDSVIIFHSQKTANFWADEINMFGDEGNNGSPENISDSSQVQGELTIGNSGIYNNTLSGGMSMGSNTIIGDGGSVTGNNLVGHGDINGLFPGIGQNFIAGNSHIDSNYIEGAVLLWNLGRGADNSSFSHNYVKNLTTNVYLQDISGQFDENVVGDTITGDNSEIWGIVLLGNDSIAFNNISGNSSGIRDVLMQNSKLNYCSLAIENAGVVASQFYNSDITHVNNQIYNSAFFNVYKDFSDDTTPWNNIMLLNDNVGVGITSKPTASFQIGDSNSTQSFRYVDGSQGWGKVLTSDGDGNATWQLPGYLGGGGSGWGLSGNSFTNTASNYIGTSDNNGLVFKTNSVAFGYIDSLQQFNFSTALDGDEYGIQTTNNLGGHGINGMFMGDESAQFGYYQLDGTPFGLSKGMLMAGSLSGCHVLVHDSIVNLQATGTVAVQSPQLSEDVQLITEFNPAIYANNVYDSSIVNENTVVGGAAFGNNTLSGGMVLGSNYLYDGGSSCVGNILVGNGIINGWLSGIASNELRTDTHLDSNYLEGATQMQDLGKNSHSSSFSHNYLKSLTDPAQIYGISGATNEEVVWDSITNGSGIFNLTLMSFDSIAYNILSGPNTNINNLIMQNSNLNYCHFLSPNTSFNFSQLFNSNLTNDTVSVANCFFHNITKDFGTETQQWRNIMLLNDNVGIGIVSKPVASLQVGDESTPQTFKYVDGNEGAGKVLTSDAQGNAAWQNNAGIQIDTVTVHLTQQQIDSLYDSPVVLIPSPGAGHYIQVLQIAEFYNYGTARYSGSSLEVAEQDSIGAPGAGLFYDNYAISNQTNSTAVYMVSNVGNSRGNVPGPGISTGSQVIIYADSPFTGGDGTVDVHITYMAW